MTSLTSEHSLALHDPEDFLELTGAHKKINYVLFVCGCFCLFFGSMNTMSYQLLGTTPEYHCEVDIFSQSNFTWQQIKNLSTSPLLQKEEDKLSTCEILNLDYRQFLGLSFEKINLIKQEIEMSGNVSTISCEKRIFDPSVDSYVTKWDLVCSKRVLHATVQATVQLGHLLGSFFLGFLSDKFGRMKSYKVSTILFTLSGTLSTFVPSVQLFILLKFLAAFGEMGFYVSSFVLVLETCSINHRSVIASFFALPWSLGMIALAGLAYVFRPWYQLQLAIYIPSVILFANFWILPESPRWLLVESRFEECYIVLQKLASANNTLLPDKEIIISQMKLIARNKDDTSNETFKEKLKKKILFLTYPFRPANICVRTLCIFFCWFSVSKVYYGISLGAATISANQNLYMLLSGILEVVSYVSLWPMIVYLGRRNSVAGLFLVSAVSILAVLVLILKEYENYSLKMALYLLGKFAITGVFHLLWIYTGELYPTEYRSVVVGEGSACARLGSMISPFINDILYPKAIYAPSAVFGGASLVAGLISLTFPETRNEKLPEIHTESCIQKVTKNSDNTANDSCVITAQAELILS